MCEAAPVCGLAVCKWRLPVAGNLATNAVAFDLSFTVSARSRPALSSGCRKSARFGVHRATCRVSAFGRMRTPRIWQRLRAFLHSLRRGRHPFLFSIDAFCRRRQPYEPVIWVKAPRVIGRNCRRRTATRGVKWLHVSCVLNGPALAGLFLRVLVAKHLRGPDG